METAQEETPVEYRGMWVTRFEWPDPNPATAQATIRKVMHDLAAHNFNAVFFQVRGQADTLYPSRYEVWSPLIGGKDPGWDPLQFALKEARKNGLEFHAYVNTHTCWHSKTKQLPTNRKHLFYRHCNPKGKHDWIICGPDGKPAPFPGGDPYVWMAPGVPAFQAYTRQVVIDLVKRYDVDGVHFDRIRTPGAGYSHDPISMARFKGRGNPHRLSFEDWTRDQFTRLLNDIYGAVAMTRPRVKVSATPVGLYDQARYPGYPDEFHYGRTKAYQDAQAWLAAKVVDFAVPQIYWGDGGPKPDFSDILPDWAKHSAGRPIVAGQNGSLPFSEIEREILFTRRLGAAGNCIFSMTSTPAEELRRYKKGLYKTPARVPGMPWKSLPEAGIIVGHVLDSKTRRPVVDAWIRRGGSDYVWLSSGDGFFAMLNVPPGAYELQAVAEGKPEPAKRHIRVEARKILRVTLLI
jgi:uncharacterized lipoprotein YddW (UPF0748 family)